MRRNLFDDLAVLFFRFIGDYFRVRAGEVSNSIQKKQNKIAADLEKLGVEDIQPAIAGKKTYIAPFVNAEETEYLVIEDAFPNGKPALDKGGIIFTDRATVDKVEKMKVCTCLNPLHTALAIYGCLLGYTLISEEMKNPLLKNMVEVKCILLHQSTMTR